MSEEQNCFRSVRSEIIKNITDILDICENDNPLSKKITLEMIMDFLDFFGSEPKSSDQLRSLGCDIYRIKYYIYYLINNKYSKSKIKEIDFAISELSKIELELQTLMLDLSRVDEDNDNETIPVQIGETSYCAVGFDSNGAAHKLSMSEYISMKDPCDPKEVDRIIAERRDK